MTEKTSKVSNPLTIIAVFAGLAETFGLSVLPFLDDDPQKVFVWFAMLFPALLLLFFFGTLWVKSEVLYSPSDFRDEKNWMLTKRKKNEANEELAIFDAPIPETVDASVEAPHTEPISIDGSSREPLQKKQSRLLQPAEKVKYSQLLESYIKDQYKNLTLESKSIQIGGANISFALGSETAKEIHLIAIVNLVYFNKTTLNLIMSRANILKAYLEKFSSKNVEISYVYLFDDSIKEDHDKKKQYEEFAKKVAGNIKTHFVDISNLDKLSPNLPIAQSI
jgi:hypothetical protein